MGVKIPRSIGLSLIAVGRAFGRLRRAILRLFFGRPPARIIAYDGLGNPQRVELRARVIDDDGLGEPCPDDSAWTQARRMFRVFDARRVADARLEVSCAGVWASVPVDARGFAVVELSQPMAIFPEGGAPVAWSLVEPDGPDRPESVPARVHIPRAAAPFAIVSDVDDTVVESRATHALKLAYETLSRNVYRRIPTPGMARFYRALTADGQPLVWLTSSIWRVHGLLSRFFELHRFPDGPLLMSDARLLRSQWVADRHATHKLGRLRQIRALWSPPLVLSGDCGQRDPEIFAEFAAEDPERVRAIYLRDLGDPARRRAVEALLEPVRAAGVAVCVAGSAAAFVRHAGEHGLLSPSAADALADALAVDPVGDLAPDASPDYAPPRAPELSAEVPG